MCHIYDARDARPAGLGWKWINRTQKQVHLISRVLLTVAQ